MRPGGIALCWLASIGACSRSSAPAAGASPLDHLTAPATVLVGFNLHGKGGDVGKLYEKAESQLPASGPKVPPCALEVAGKLDDGAFAYDTATRSGRIVVRGAGLRGAAEACLMTLAPDAKIADEGTVTHYRIGAEEFYVLWVGDSLAIAAPDADAAATAALAETPAPVRKDDRVASLLGRVDVAQPYWFVVDLTTLDLANAPFRPQTAWGTIEEQAIHATLALPTANEAAKLASLAKELPRQVASQIQPLLDDFSVEVQGTQTTFTLRYGKLLAMAGVGEKDIPPSAMPTVALGVIAAVAVPAFMKYVKKTKTSEPRVVLRRLYEGAFAEYGLSHKLPSSTGVTPPLGACCKGKGSQCAPDAKLWETPEWKALRFSVDDPSRYSYEFTSDKTSFTARAYGDLNCDGAYSTFEIRGDIAADGTITTKGVVAERELE